MSGLLTEASLPESQTRKVTDAQIEALLARADEEIGREQKIAWNPDADELLQIVEMELEQSFRVKVFDILKEGFHKTRTAVLNRNHSSQ